ncbi:ABC transporter ATP-binding protein [Candidatus Woesearchaeota archaeon]|nr:ABC transporter ATP-binding protein [Candidatus Woesearchaeota archaeon]
MSDDNTVVRVSNLNKKFGKRYILKDINLDIKKGESFGIIGVSGSGKTTLMKVMVGFLLPDDGQVLFRNMEVLKPVHRYAQEAKKSFGFAAQEPSFYLELKVWENLEHFASLFGVPGGEKKQVIEKLLKKVDLLDAKDNLTMKLSGGMRKRLGLIAATIHNPPVFVLDEPTADLDPYSRRQVMKFVKDVNNEGKTVIIASHHLDDIEEMCDKIAVVHEGKILMTGTPDQLKKNYMKDKKIEVHTTSEDYTAIKENIKNLKLNIKEIKEERRRLIVKTEDVVSALVYIMATIRKSRDELLDISIEKPSLNEVFEDMMCRENKAAK